MSNTVIQLDVHDTRSASDYILTIPEDYDVEQFSYLMRDLMHNACHIVDIYIDHVFKMKEE